MLVEYMDNTYKVTDRIDKVRKGSLQSCKCLLSGLCSLNKEYTSQRVKRELTEVVVTQPGDRKTENQKEHESSKQSLKLQKVINNRGVLEDDKLVLFKLIGWKQIDSMPMIIRL